MGFALMGHGGRPLAELNDDLFAAFRPHEGVFPALQPQEARESRGDPDDERVPRLGDRDLLGEAPEAELLCSCFDLLHRLLIDERLSARVADLCRILPQVYPEHLLPYLSRAELSLATHWTRCHRLTI